MSRAPAVEKRWYETALGQFALHSGSFEKMSGHVEVDETFIGGNARNMEMEDFDRFKLAMSQTSDSPGTSSSGRMQMEKRPN